MAGCDKMTVDGHQRVLLVKWVEKVRGTERSATRHPPSNNCLAIIHVSESEREWELRHASITNKTAFIHLRLSINHSAPLTGRPASIKPYRSTSAPTHIFRSQSRSPSCTPLPTPASAPPNFLSAADAHPSTRSRRPLCVSTDQSSSGRMYRRGYRTSPWGFHRSLWETGCHSGHRGVKLLLSLLARF